MPLKMSPLLRNLRATQLGVFLAGGSVELRSGSQPASTTVADSGLLLCSVPLPLVCFGTASNGTVLKSGTWQGLATQAASINGSIIGHFRMKASHGAVGLDGSVSLTEGGGQMILSTLKVRPMQLIQVLFFSYTDGNA